MTGISWRPGAGWGVVTDQLAVWLPDPVDPGLLIELFALSGPGAASGAAELLARDAPAYALLRYSEGEGVAIRCAGAVPVRAWDAAGVALGADVRTAACVEVGETGSEDVQLPLAAGVVRAGAIRWGERVDAAGAPSSGRTGTAGDLQPSAAPTPPQTLAPAPVPPVIAGVVPSRQGFIAELPEWMASAEANPFAELWGHTMRRPVEAAAVRIVRDSDADPGEEALAEPPVVAGRAPVPAGAPPVAAPARSVASPATATLVGAPDEGEMPPADHGEVVGPDGRRVAIIDTVVIGRAPSTPTGQAGELLRVTSPQRSISRSHVVVSLIDGLVRGKDLGSNNGTVLRRGGGQTPLRTDAWTALADGDVLDLGEDVTVRLVGLP